MAVSSVLEVGGVSALVGIEFGDNFDQEYLTPQNGIAIARTEVKLKLQTHFIGSEILLTISLGHKSVNILCLDLPQMESLDQLQDGSF